MKEILMVLKPKKRVSGFTLFSGSVYSAPFAFGKVIAVNESNAAISALTEGTSTALAAGQFYHDTDAGVLYVRKTASGAVVSTDWIVVRFELYIGTREVMFNRVPTDSTTSDVLFRGVIETPPTVDHASEDILFGFKPVSATSVGCVFDPTYLQELLYDISFNGCDVVAYHVAGSFRTANVTKILTAMGANFTVDDGHFTLDIVDKTFNFDRPLNNGAVPTVYTLSPQSGVGATDPAYAGKAIRSIYGFWAGCRGVCLDYKIESPGTADNRKWGFMTSAWRVGNLDATVTSVSTSSIFTVSLFDAARWQTAYDYGFTKLLKGGVTPTDIINIDVATGTITVSPAIFPSVSDVFTLLGFQNVYLVKGGTTFTWYKLAHGTHFTTYNSGAESNWGVQVINNVEGALGCATINPATDFIIGDALGADIQPTYGGSLIQSTRGAGGNPVVILYHILKDRLGLAESEINGASFITAAAAVTDLAAVSIPLSEADSFPTYRDTIARLLTTALCRAYIDANGCFAVAHIGPASVTPAATLDESDLITKASFEYQFQDIVDIKLANGPIEFSLARDKTVVLAGGVTGAGTFCANVLQREYEWSPLSNKYLHQTNRQMTIDTYFYSNPILDAMSVDGVQAHAKRIGYILGDRRCRMTVYARSGAWSLEIGDTVAVTRKKLPGFPFDSNTDQTRSFVVTEIKKEKNGVQLVLDDQKSIQENSGVW